jgi:hypothetical protein
MNATTELVAAIHQGDPYLMPPEEAWALQLEAVRERADEGRAAIRVLDKRARDAGVSKIDTFQDLLPLLFTDTVYKSYPESFMRANRWDRMTLWYNTLTTASTDNVDLSGVTDVDSWLDQLWEAGHFAYASSGTSGKCSFLPAVQADRDFHKLLHSQQLEWAGAGKPAQDRRWYQLVPRTGHQAMIEGARMKRELYARPDAVRYLTEGPMRVSDVNEVAAMRRAITDGTASPADIERFEARVASRAEEMRTAIEEMANDIIENRHDPMMINGMWAQHWAIMEIAHSRGIPDGEFHPGTVIVGLGGTKGARLPPDYQERIYAFYGNTVRPASYNMTELSTAMPACAAGRYHRPPWLALIVLNDTGDRVLEPNGGKLVGRAAFFNVALHGRWGGVISGDRVTVDLGTCGCGRPGPTIGKDVLRYAEIEGGGDKLSCAGTMDAYVRGMVEG